MLEAIHANADMRLIAVAPSLPACDDCAAALRQEGVVIANP